MKKSAFVALIAVALAMTSNSVFAEVVIDNFDAPGFPGEQHMRINNSVAAALTNTTHNGVAAAGAFGGTRDLELTRQNPVGSTYVDVNRINTGSLTYVQSQTTSTDDVDGAFAITWDGTSDGGGAANVDSNPGALAGGSAAPTLNVLDIDLTEGGLNNAIQLTGLSNSVTILSLTLEIYDALGLASTVTLSNLVPSNAANYLIQFSDFSNPNAFDHVAAIKLKIDVDNSVGGATLTLDKIAAVATVPEPASLALLGLGAIGMAAGARFRRRAAK